MDVFLIILVLYLCACMLFAQASEDLFDVLGRLIAFAVIMVITVVFYVGRGVFSGLVFIGIIFDELLQDWGVKRRRSEYEEELGSDEQSFDTGGDLFESACRVLELPKSFTKAELRHAFHEAMKKAHPDAGGAVEEAQKINEAREIIELQKGWA